LQLILIFLKETVLSGKRVPPQSHPKAAARSPQSANPGLTAVGRLKDRPLPGLAIDREGHGRGQT